MLKLLGFFWIAVALIFSSTSIDDIANMEKLSPHLNYVLEGFFITLIDSIFTVGSVLIKENISRNSQPLLS